MSAFLAATRISRLGGNHPLLNPTLLAIILISLGLEATHTPYEVYLRGADVVHFMLGPAVVLLAVPLFRQRAVIRASARLIAMGLAVGLPVGVLSAVGIAWVLGASSQTILSVSPKSVTAGIAVGISEQIGGLQTFTIVLVIMTGISGAVLGPNRCAPCPYRRPACRGSDDGHCLAQNRNRSRAPDQRGRRRFFRTRHGSERGANCYPASIDLQAAVIFELPTGRDDAGQRNNRLVGGNQLPNLRIWPDRRPTKATLRLVCYAGCVLHRVPAATLINFFVPIA